MKFLHKALALAAFAMTASAFPDQSNAQSMPICPTSGTATQADMANYPEGCRGTPTRYVISIYEMGLCTANPIASGSYDPSSCVPTLISSGGQSVNLAGGASINLSSGPGGERPENGTYPYAYIHIGNTFGLNGSYELCGLAACGDGAGGGTWYSDGQDPDVAPGGDNADNTLAAGVDFVDILTTFGPSNGPCTTTAYENVGGGRLDALLVDTNLTPSCTGAAKIIGSFAPSTPITIDDTVTGIDVGFTVTNNGMSISPANDGTIMSFLSGPFNPIFTILN